ncbi:hypothetical protein F5146DRAFT_1072442, partial [Armillaria mellea]
RGSQPINVFSVAPRLRSFTKSSGTPFLLLTNLVDFCDTQAFHKNTLTTLRGIVNIETLSLCCSIYSSELPRVHLPRLSQLELRVDPFILGAAFITYNHFDLPSLTHLQMTLIFSHGMTRMAIPHVVQPINSSTVTSLILTWTYDIYPEISASDVDLDLSSFCRLPNLRCLTVEDCPNINPFLKALSIHPRRDVMFPKLSRLDIKCGRDSALSKDLLDMQILVTLVQSRRDQGALRKFRLAWKRGLVNDDADTRSRWRQLTMPGGGIQISASIKGEHN